MSTENILDETIKFLGKAKNTVSDKYDNHIREQAIEKVNEKIQTKGLDIDQIQQNHY